MKQNLKNILIIIMATIFSVATVYADNIPLEAGKEVTINITLDEITAIKGAFAFTNIEAVQSISYDHQTLDMIGDISSNYCTLTSTEPKSGKIAVTIRLKSDAQAGEIVTFAFSYKTTDIDGVESNTKISKATIEVEESELTYVEPQVEETKPEVTEEVSDPLIKVTDDEDTVSGLESIETEVVENDNEEQEIVQEQDAEPEIKDEPQETQEPDQTADVEQVEQEDTISEQEPEPEEPEPEPEIDDEFEVSDVSENEKITFYIIIFVAGILFSVVMTTIVILALQKRRKNKVDNVPLVEYDIFDDDI
ncbi:MAG: hypothetical protein R3Y09_10475 [Clostridia bacterium]